MSVNKFFTGIDPELEDTMSKNEQQRYFNRILANLERKVEAYEFPIKFAMGQKTDASGNAQFMVYQVPGGNLDLRINRFILWADGFSPANAYTNASCWAGIFHGAVPSTDALFDYVPTTPGGQIFPSLLQYNSATAMKVQDREEGISFRIITGPANTQVTVMGWGYLFQTEDDRKKAFAVEQAFDLSKDLPPRKGQVKAQPRSIPDRTFGRIQPTYSQLQSDDTVDEGKV
jgi:hypothetical protein